VGPVGGEELRGIDVAGSQRKHNLAPETTSGSTRYDCAVARGVEDDIERGKENIARQKE